MSKKKATTKATGGVVIPSPIRWRQDFSMLNGHAGLKAKLKVGGSLHAFNFSDSKSKNGAT